MSSEIFYNDYWKSRGQSKGLRLRYQIILDWIKPESTVLDLGGGDGHLAQILKKEKNCQPTVLDIAQSALEIAENRGLATIKASLIDKLPIADNAFDAVILSEVLEHLAEAEEVLSEAKRVSKEFIYVTVPNTGYFKYRLQLLFGRFPKQWLISPREHLRFWTLADFKKMVSAGGPNHPESLGLEIVKMKASAGRRYLRDLWPSMMAEQLCFKLKKIDR